MKLALALTLTLLVGVCSADGDFAEGICTLEYSPLCASDGRTYANDCEFKHRQKMTRKLNVLGRGTCDELIRKGQAIPAPEL